MVVRAEGLGLSVPEETLDKKGTHAAPRSQRP